MRFNPHSVVSTSYKNHHCHYRFTQEPIISVLEFCQWWENTDRKQWNRKQFHVGGGGGGGSRDVRCLAREGGGGGARRDFESNLLQHCDAVCRIHKKACMQ